MTTAKIVLSAALAFPFSFVLRAQPMTPLPAGQSSLSLSSAVTVSGDGKLNDGHTTYGDVSVTNYAWTLNQRVDLDGYRTLTVGLDYNLIDIDAKQSSQRTLPDRLQSIGASVRYSRPINAQWVISASVGAASQVTDTGLLSDGWGARASAVGIYNRSQRVTFMGGLAYNSLSQDFKLVPVVGCDWRPTERWSFAFGFPKTGVTYKLTKQLAIGLAASGSSGVFYVKNDPLPGAASHSLERSHLQYLEAGLGVSADWRINDTFRVSSTIGQVLYRQFKYIDRDFKLHSRGTVPFFSVSGSLSL